MLAKIFDDGGFGILKRDAIDLIAMIVDHDNLAEDAEAGMHAAFLREIFEHDAIGIGARFTPGEDIITHLVGEVNEIHLMKTETLLGDGIIILVIIILTSRGDGNFVALEDELISSTDILVEAVIRKSHEVE